MCLGIPGRVMETYTKDELPMGKVEIGGIRKEVCLAYTPEVQVGDYVIVHVGFAISRVDEAEAEEIFSYLEQIQAAADAEPTEPPAGPSANASSNSAGEP